MLWHLEPWSWRDYPSQGWQIPRENKLLPCKIQNNQPRPHTPTISFIKLPHTKPISSWHKPWAREQTTMAALNPVPEEIIKLFNPRLTQHIYPALSISSLENTNNSSRPCFPLCLLWCFSMWPCMASCTSCFWGSVSRNYFPSGPSYPCVHSDRAWEK